MLAEEPILLAYHAASVGNWFLMCQYNIVFLSSRVKMSVKNILGWFNLWR